MVGLHTFVQHMTDYDHSEVESLINLSVHEVVQEIPAAEPYRRELIDKLIQALESDAAWVQLYGLTGELVVPDFVTDAGSHDFDSILGRVKEVRFSLLIRIHGNHSKLIYEQVLRHKRPPELSFGEWREITIPVDIPQMHVSRVR